jgi:anti-sigma regulatory factor (Ser/Thr protein kinase)
MADPNAAPKLPEQIISERSRLAIPSLPNWIEPTVEFLRQKAVLGGVCGETRSGKLMIALHEAITNAVVHGNLEVSSALKEQADSAFAEALAQRAADQSYSSRDVDIAIDYDGDVCHWMITDQGKGFDVESVIARCTSDDPAILLASGRGILLMKSFLDDVRYDLGGRRVILSLRHDSGKEKRSNARIPLTTPFEVTPIHPDGTPEWSATYGAMSRNISESGVALLQKQLAHTTKVLIGISTEYGIIHVPADVKHSRPLGAHGMELGCHFQQAAVPDTSAGLPPVVSEQLEEVHSAIMQMLDGYQARQVAPHERRVHQRIVFNERIAVHLDGRAEPIVAFARDLSKGGMAFIAEEPLPEQITIAFAAGPARVGLRVRCLVARCSRIQEGFYDIGATFQRLDRHGAG